MKKTKLNTQRLVDVIAVTITIVLMVLALIECIKTRHEINRYLDYIIVEDEECLEDTSLE